MLRSISAFVLLAVDVFKLLLVVSVLQKRTAIAHHPECLLLLRGQPLWLQYGHFSITPLLHPEVLSPPSPP